MQSTYLKSKFKIKIHVLLSLLHKDLNNKEKESFLIYKPNQEFRFTGMVQSTFKPTYLWL